MALRPMSADPPQPPDGDPTDSGEPSDLREVEGLQREADRDPAPSASMSMSVVELPRASRPGEADDPEQGDYTYEVEALPRGTQLGRYVLLGRVSGRSEEVVYGAYDPEGDRKIGLKLFHPGGEADKDARARRMQLVRQAQRVARLSHPCVEQVYETGVYGPWVFLATEFIDGIDVGQWMEARDDPFPWPEVLRVFREAGRGLAAAHKQGIVHRDFKPANILMGKEGRLVVVDFGVVHEVEEEDDDIDISQLRESLSGAGDETEATRMSGTPAYMAPEQHLSGHSDAQSDQFSFCVALYEALYGERPFSGNRPRAIALEAAKHKVRAAPEGSTVPGWLRAVVLRGLSPQPQARFESMEALLRELARDPADRRKRWVWGLALIGGLAAVGGLVAMQVEADRSACDDESADHSMASVWTEERRESIHDTFLKTERRWAEPTWSYTESKLDQWANDWRDLSERACLATRVWADASEMHYELRVACLDRHLAGFESTLDVMAEVDGRMLDHAHVLASELPGPQQCLDTETLVAHGLPSDDEREEVEGLHRELSGLEARLMMGSPAPVLQALTTVEARIEAIDDHILKSRAELLRGRALLATADPEAEDALHAAAQSALRAGHPRLAVQAWLSRIDALLLRDRALEAAALGDYVEATARHKRFTWLWAPLETARGDADLGRGRPAEALAHYHAAIEPHEVRTEADRLRLVPAWSGQSEVFVARDDLDEALPPLETALDEIRNALGPHHPAAIAVLQRIGQVQRARGELGNARLHFEQALELVRRSEAGDVPLRFDLEASVGTLLAAEGDAVRALPHLQEAYTGMGGPLGALEAKTFQLGLALARAHESSEEAASARKTLEALLDPLSAHPYPVTANEREPSVAERIDAETMLATLMWKAGEQAESHALAASILERLDDSPAHEIYRGEVQRWQDEHPLP